MKQSSAEGQYGHLCLVLHAHMPFIRYPEHERHIEEAWLYEAVTETYLPLLTVFEDLLNDGADFRVTISLSPTLICMFEDPLLRARCALYLDSLTELAKDEISRTKNDPDIARLAVMYHERSRRMSGLYNNTYRRDLVSAFRSLSDSGCIELITSAATHAYLPALLPEPASVRAQLSIGTDYFSKVTRVDKGGVWLPECGFTPEMDRHIGDAGIKFFFIEGHGIMSGTPPGRYGIYAPVRTPSGAVAFARDVDSSWQVWSSVGGYPGDPSYRDFYRDIGFDLEFENIRAFLPHGIRTFTGLKYYRITGPTDRKLPYIPGAAQMKAEEHAYDFMTKKNEQAEYLYNRLGIKPIITAAYDAELFGHWWFEGPQWLKSFLTQTSVRRGKTVRLITPSEYISENPDLDTSMPAMSSWGKKGYSSTWIDETNDWTYRHIMRASRLMAEMSRKNINASGIRKRALDQAAREMLLAQASDWTFMMNTGNSAAFATAKFTDHIKNFFDLHRMISEGGIDDIRVGQLENRNNIFPTLDFRTFLVQSGPV